MCTAVVDERDDHRSKFSNLSSWKEEAHPFGHRFLIEGLLYFFEQQPYLASHVTTAEKALKLKLSTFYNNEYNTNVQRALFGTS